MESGADGIRTHDLLRARQGPGASQRRWALSPRLAPRGRELQTLRHFFILVVFLQQGLDARVIAERVPDCVSMTIECRDRSEARRADV